MNTASTITASLALGCAQLAWAQCEITPTVVASTTTPQALEIRNAIFMKLCADSGGELVDGDDKLVNERLVRPSKRARIDTYTSRPPPNGSAVVAIVIGTNGVVKWVSVLEVSGNKDFKSYALSFFHNQKLIPATLDGRPVQVFQTLPLRFGPQE
jgi:TonB family protein